MTYCKTFASSSLHRQSGTSEFWQIKVPLTLLYLPPFIFPQGGNAGLSIWLQLHPAFACFTPGPIPPWGKVGKGVKIQLIWLILI